MPVWSKKSAAHLTLHKVEFQAFLNHTSQPRCDARRCPQRVSRVMALAIECDRLIRDGVIKNQSELAHYAQVTTARMTHIMWLTNLAPEIQEAILFLPRVESGPDTIKEIEVRRIARVLDWGVQRGRWESG